MRDMKPITLSCLLIGVFTLSGKAAEIRSAFTASLEGWTAADTVGGTPTHVAAGGNPGGYVFLDNAENLWTYVVAPAAFLGDLSGFDGGTLSFDGDQLTGNGLYESTNFNYGNVYLIGPTVTTVLDLAQGPVPVGPWVTYSASLDAATWGATPADWATLLSNVTEIRVYLEGTFGSETNGFDNFVIESAVNTVPEPTSFALIAAGIGVALARRYRAG